VIPGVFGGFRSYIILGVHGIIVLKPGSGQRVDPGLEPGRVDEKIG